MNVISTDIKWGADSQRTLRGVQQLAGTKLENGQAERPG